jgi:hypothetical protein
MTHTPAGDSALPDVLADPPRSRIALVVWVGHDAAGGFEGTVERARTGEKERFRGMAALSELIARMVGGHQ